VASDFVVNGWTWLALVVLVAYWIAAVVVIVAENREPTVTLSWILVLTLLPFVGLPIYFFVGRDWKRVHARQGWVRSLRAIRKPFMGAIRARYAGYADDVRRQYAGTPVERLIGAISRERGNEPLPALELAIWPSGAEYFPHLLDDIAAARHSIHMQYYTWERDELTTRICDALLERLRAGVEVRILYDFVGSVRFGKDQLVALKKAGARVGADVSQVRKLNYRDHRKLTVIDGRVGHTGGVNIGQEYVDGGARFPAWRDTGMRFTGPAVAELQMLFAERWYEVFRESLFEEAYFGAADGAAIGAAAGADDAAADADGAAVAPGSIATQVVAQGVEEFWSSSTRAHEIAISGAERRVLVQSPYWVPDPTMLDAFVNAALAGVEVRLMMTGLPDKRLAFYSAQSYWEPLLRAGVHVHLYMGGFMHAKSIVVDGAVCAIGTMNLDIRSLRLNQELMVWVYDAGVAREQEAVFEADMAKCVDVTLEDIASWSALRRFRNSAARLASNLL
jgi:cardiolipin synthase